MKYDDEYYKKIMKLYKYTTVNSFCNVSQKEAQKRWISAYNLDPVINGYSKKEKTLFIMGIGINYVPHLGTVMQILNAIYLQKRGCKVEIILGDLDVYGARSIELNDINRIIKKYKRFIINLGFDIKKGMLRTQYERDDIVKTAYIISNFIDDKDFYEIEEDINGIYKQEHVYDGMKFNVKQSIALMFADFIHPGLREKYSHVVVLSGIDEHGYAWKADQIRKRMNLPMTISSLHTIILPGLSDYPKMSKSLEHSSINVSMTKKELKQIFSSDNADVNNLIYQLMCNVPHYSEERIKQFTLDYKEKDLNWENDKKRYINDLYDICKKWK